MKPKMPTGKDKYAVKKKSANKREKECKGETDQKADQEPK